jgi:uncharacterized protein YciI
MSQNLFLATRSRGPRWDDAQPMEAQDQWTAHANFMDALEREGFVVLGGPIVGTRDVLLVIRATSAEEIESRLAEDPWRHNGLLVELSIHAWTLRLGHLQ